MKTIWRRTREALYSSNQQLDLGFLFQQRSALAYHNDSSLDGGLNRMNVGISTTSTTSRSTSKSSGGLYRPDGYLGHSMSTSNSNNGPTSSHHYPPNAGIAPYGYDSSMFHDKPADGTWQDSVSFKIERVEVKRQFQNRKYQKKYRF